jgi:sterol desaturase/sphingolipid hydroxylase (fatty acid hydroxylase superfamily)
MALSILSYGLTALVTYYLATFVQASLHCLLGHTRLGRSLYLTHVGSHHAIYSDVLVSGSYSDSEESLTAYYVAPAIILVGSAYVTLSFDLLLAHLCSLGLAFYSHVYLHGQYHLTNSWLRRFRWFQRKQRLHFTHHKDPSKNFAVIEFTWDRLFGTFQGTAA